MHIRPGPPKFCKCSNQNIIDSFSLTTNKIKNMKQHTLVTTRVSRRLGCLNSDINFRTVFTKYQKINNFGRHHSNNGYNFKSGHLVIQNF
jgi:hypothetical protein